MNNGQTVSDEGMITKQWFPTIFVPFPLFHLLSHLWTTYISWATHHHPKGREFDTPGTVS